MFIYPDNLKAKATLWLWELRDVAIIGVGFLFSVLAIAQTGILLPSGGHRPLCLSEHPAGGLQYPGLSPLCCMLFDFETAVLRMGGNH